MRKVACAALLLVATGGSARADEPAAASPAQADGVVAAVDVGTTALVEKIDSGMGLGLDARLGYTFTGLPSFTPELSLGLVDFPELDLLGRGGAGGRLTLGKAVQASVFAHGGGWWNDSGAGGPAGDLGLAVDFVLSRELSAGVQGAYNIVWVEIFDQYVDVPYASMGVHVAWTPRAEPARAAPVARAARR